MPYLNKIFIMGNLTRDPELKYTPQGTAVCKLGIAVSRQWESADGEQKKETDFFDIVVWGKSGENCSKFLAKGRPVHVEGRLQTRSYEAQDGQKRKITELVAEHVTFLGGSNERTRKDAHEPGQHDTAPDPDTQVPF